MNKHLKDILCEITISTTEKGENTQTATITGTHTHTHTHIKLTNQQHKNDSTHGQRQMVNTEIRLTIFFAVKDEKALKNKTGS